MKAITVTGDIGRFTGGQVLNTAADIIGYHREMANEGSTKGNTTLSDAQILACVNAVEGDNEDAEFERMALIDAGKVPATATGTVQQAKGNISAARRELEAKELAIRADNDPGIAETLAQVWEKKGWLAFSARIVQLDLARIYGDEMKAWPIIGAVSHVDGKRDQPTGHPNPDGYLRPTRRRGSTGGTAMAYWSDAFAENLKPIRDLRLQLETVKESKSLLDMAKEQARDKLEKRINAMKAKVRAGIELFQQLGRAADYPACTVVFEMEKVPVLDASGNPVKDPKNPNRVVTKLVEAIVESPIVLRDSDPAVTDFKCMSITQFCSLDFDKANENGGTLEALLDTAKREKKDKVGFDIEDMEDLRLISNTLASFVMDKANKIALLREIVTENEDNDEMLVSMADIVQSFRPIVEANAKRINAMRDKLDGKDTAAAA